MHINLEAAETHAVQAYSDNQIQIDSIVYERSLIVSKEEIIGRLKKEIAGFTNDSRAQLIERINGINTGKFPPMSLISKLSQLRIGIECMSIGAACRTYNILLGEQRAVVAGFILP